MTARADVAKVQQRVLRWFDDHARPFPWRTHRDPYATMVAEVMLQQTQTARVGPSYETFLQRFPDVERLAHAPAMDVIAAWKGLGYNKRAVNLQRAAQQIMHEHGGEVPADPAALRALPGLGAYSASAIACFAYDAQVPVVDVNVHRVLARAAHGKDPAAVTARAIEATASRWLPVGDAYRWNQALMDVGALFCRIDTPLCSKCPLKNVCAFKANGAVTKARSNGRAAEPFEGSRRQQRGGIVDHLRDAAARGLTLGALAKAMHHERDRDLLWLVDLLDGLERDGLVEMTEAARRGSPRGVVRLPR